MSSVPDAWKVFAQFGGQGSFSRFLNGDAVNATLADYDLGDGSDQWGKSFTPATVDTLSLDVWVQANHATQNADKEIDSVAIKVFYQTASGAIVASSLNIGPSIGL
ncbi:MAG: hypothetical protein ACREJD_09430 [Phycisphaerales bacterium]